MRDSPYIGPPSSSIDKAWNALFSSMPLRVPLSTLTPNNQSSVPLPAGGYLAWLGVFHELHCVRVLYRANYRSNLHPNLTGQELRDEQVHADHCVDMLREAAMCHGDTESLTTFVWSNTFEKPLLNPQRVQHRCLNWDTLVGSLQGWVVGDAEFGALKKPE
jgi:hypothetical protein